MTRTNFWIGYVLTMILLTTKICSAQETRLRVEGNSELVSDEFNITVRGLNPGQEITIHTNTLDQRDRPWLSTAVYRANQNGTVSLKDLEPIKGSYIGKDAMGLFWSATYNGYPLDSTRAVFARRALSSSTTKILLELDNHTVDSISITRSFIAEGIKRDSIRHQNFRGIYYVPKEPLVNGAVIVLAGSDGGITSADWRAALLASSGIPALALAFFDYDDLPEDLIEIPLEYLNEAITFLNSKNHEKVGLLGFSKGSEMALAYVSKVENNLSALVAISPSSYAWQGINRNVDVKSSWTLKNKPVDFVNWQYNAEVISMLQSRSPKRFRLLYQHSLSASDSLTLANAELNLENTKAPVLLIAGEDDGSWPANIMVDRLYDFKLKNDSEFDIEKIIFEDAGHLIYFDFLPVTDSRIQGGQIFGGTIMANIEARRKAWSKTLSFLLNNLD